MANNPNPAELLAVAVSAAKRAGDVIRSKRAAEDVKVSFKAARNLVTTTDIEAEQVIIGIIRSAFPSHLILAEETAESVPPEDYASHTVWIIDPVDGTTNFAHGHFNVGVSIACAVNGVVQAGAVLAPFLDELFTATRDGGAQLNGSPIRVNDVSRFEDALIATGFPYVRTNVPNVCARLARVLTGCRDIRRNGAASLDICWVACGRLDCFYEETLMPWDGAAGCLIAREAGASIGHFPYDSDTQRRTERYPGELMMDNIVVSAPGVFEELMLLLAGSR
jgi:myo-inositol-1(or 4)-monophosphatase